MNRPPSHLTVCLLICLMGLFSGACTTSSAPGGGDGPPAEDVCTIPDAATPTAANPSCAAPDPAVHGSAVPWKGLVCGDQSFTCNRCPGGLASGQGSWRLIDTASDDPATELPGGIAQRLIVDGNTWRLRRTWDDSGNTGDHAVTGWYLCSDPAEMQSADQVFFVATVVPEGALKYRVGDGYSGTWQATDDRLTWTVWSGLHEGVKFEERYCRIGADKDCVDPYDE